MKKTTLLLLAAFGCDGGDNDVPETGGPTRFVVRIDNIAPWTVLKSATQGTAPLGPGESLSVTFTAGVGHAINFASMFGESNDWFFAPDANGIPLYDDRRMPMAGDVTSYVKLWDAGTELDQEPAVGDATAPKQPSPNFGEADPQPGVHELPVAVALDTGATFTRPAVASMIKVTLTPGADREFTLTLQNVSTASTLMTSAGAMPIHLSPFAWSLHLLPAPLFDADAPDRGMGLERVAEDGNPAPLGESLATLTGFHTPLSPGVFVVHRDANALYTVGQADYGLGLERIAEDGNPMPLATALTGELAPNRSASGAFDTAIDAAMPGPAMPGSSFQIDIVASPGDHLSLAMMFGMSNDWFFATVPAGIELFDDDKPRRGDVTSSIALYDIGTEIDEEIDIGPDTAPQQPAPNTGPADPNAIVRAAAYDVPVASHLRVTLAPQ